ncbi:McrC family protein [Methanosalsum natronophilum]|uniref:McrC family protein n=1 Tax=Methanosalsum natronophilum TaxID=768733 RepID=UPI002169139B|nr:McrC family protein [Methanosalsum natronophilum]MCS3924437.1 5-methylcytosine-specific restriction enzyme subunit McrC [Methanosalsum natronophilum]
MDDMVILEEYKGKTVGKITDNDVEYLNLFFLRENPNSFNITYNKDGDVRLENTSYAGVIQLENVRIHFSTKVKANLFYMLSFLKSEKHFIFDSQKTIEIKDGGNFFDIIGKLFYNEIEDVIKCGLLKKYVTKEENEKFLKGKLLFNEQINQNLFFKPKFYCRYHDLTYDNLENQIILRGTNLLIPLIRFNDKLRYSLSSVEKDLKQEISFNPYLSKKDCDSICYNRLSEHYSPLIEFSKLIFEEHFIRSVQKGESKGFNFIVNMPKVYEDFLTEMIKEVVHEEFHNFEVASQLSFNTLVKERKLTTRPDIIIEDKNGNFPIILDAKYKVSDSNTDYYQMIAYSLAIKSSKKCCLLYPENGNIENVNYTVYKDLENSESDTINLCIRTIPLFEEENEDFDSFIKRIKIYVKNILDGLLEGY